MKTHFYALIFACSLASPLAQAGGILVFDATAKLENVRQWQKEAKQWMETAQQERTDYFYQQSCTGTSHRILRFPLSVAKLSYAALLLPPLGYL